MPTEIVVTTLPKGTASGGRARLSVLLTPRLLSSTKDTVLSEFAFDHWTQKAAALTFKVYFGAAGVAGDAQIASPSLRDDLWEVLFPSDTYVRAYAYPGIVNAEILSYAAASIKAFTETTYASLLSEAEDLFLAPETLIKAGFFGAVTPPTRVVQGDGDTVKRGTAKVRVSKDALSERESVVGRLDVSATRPAAPDPVVDFYEADARFFAVKERPRLSIDKPGPTARVNRRIDFHQMVSLLAQHPKLQRLLGVVFDLEVDIPAGLTKTAGTIDMWTQPAGVPGVQYKIPKTRTQVKGMKAAPRPTPQSSGYNPTEPRHQNGLLNLSNTFPDGRRVYELLDLDTDSAAVKISRFGRTIKSTLQRADTRLQTEDEEGSLEGKLSTPSLRSPGLSLVHSGRSFAWLQNLKLSALNNTALKLAGANGEADQDVLLYLEDIVRGYAIDVFDEEKGRWFPLTARTGTATFFTDLAAGDGIEVPLEAGDGWVTFGATKDPKDPDAPDSSGKDEYYVHEAMFRWLNWSLVVPRPGKSLDKDETVPTERFTNVPQTEFPLGVDYDVPPTAEGKLPILRYNRSYRARARVVDLAGNATGFGDPTALAFGQATESTPFTRLEPIPPPPLLMRKKVTSGESVERMVIRSNFNTAASATTPNERHIAPPKIDAYSAELHGMFDTPTGLDPSAYSVIAARDGGSFEDSPAAQSDPNNHGVPHFDVDTLSFPVEAGKTAKVPYLPDPLARGAAFIGLPGAANVTRLLFDLDVEWPEVTPHRLRLKEGDSANALVGNVMEISIPKASIRTVRYGSYHDPSSLPVLGLMRWFARLATKQVPKVDKDEQEARRIRLLGWVGSQSRRYMKGSMRAEDGALSFMQNVAREVQKGRFKPTSEEARRLARVVDGTNPMVTPFRTLTLVHAVRQPLVAPAFVDPQIKRKIGWTYADFDDDVVLDTHSTVGLDVHAEWTEVADRFHPSTGAWEPRAELPMKAVAFRYDIPYERRARPTKLGRQEFGDTRYREVRYTAIATSRFKEYFTERIETTISSTSTNLPSAPAFLGGSGVVDGSEIVKSLPKPDTDIDPGASTTYVRGTDYAMDYDAGTIRRLAEGSIGSTQVVSITYVKKPITRETEGEAVVVIPNSARPAAPKVLYVMPTFRWTRSATGGGAESTREGRGLRVYLDRPWWSSGDEEKLGVLIRPAATKTGGGLSPKVVPYITRWGVDPLWSYAPTSSYPTSKDFETGSAGERDEELTLAEVPGGLLTGTPTVAVRAHNVEFDEERRLWFCDIVMKTNAYTPFVRLALARYQPNSIDGAHLSRVVLADIMQLTPDRTLSVTFDASDPKKVSISLSGNSYLKGPAGKGPSTVEVSLEQRRPEVADVTEELGWDPVPDSTTVLKGSFFLSIAGWTGTVTLPVDLGEQRFRLVIREYERIPKAIVGRVQPGKRLVYVETVELAGPEQPPDLPDLTFSATTATSFTVKNIGDGAAAAFTVVLRDASGATLETFNFTGLGAGQESTRQIASSPSARTVVADPGNLIQEASDNNNTATIPSSGVLPDLTVTGTTPTSFTMANLGQADAGFFIARIQNASTSEVLQDFQYPGLAAGDQLTQEVATATFSRTVFLDPSNSVAESNDNNNIGTIPTASPSPSPTLLPDLVISATTTTSFTIRNAGSGAAGAFQARVTLNVGGTVQSTHNYSSLAAGATVTTVIPASSSARTVTADSASQVAESNEGNNTGSIPALPDLIVFSTTTTSFTLRNQGAGAAGAFQAQVRFTGGSVISTHNYTGLAAGASTTTSIASSTSERTVVVDSANQVVEGSESNNTRAIPPVPPA